ncbi:hypothetical protein ACOWPH_31020 (plasmid) [Anabaena sp. PCC 7938]|nr:hypothetical protein [Anabaena sp. CCAP 1446/1C]MBY5285709.1 hypothetical protein [Anabaena sp. CCAP 1446/1C]MCM2410208.1 hypothetical protein [Anabaena sp. CCAP 1446/1C]
MYNCTKVICLLRSLEGSIPIPDEIYGAENTYYSAPTNSEQTAFYAVA